MGQIIAVPAEIRRWLIQLYLIYTSNNKLIRSFIGLKDRFWWGMYRKRGQVFCGRKLKETSKFLWISCTLIPVIEFPISVAHGFFVKGMGVFLPMRSTENAGVENGWDVRDGKCRTVACEKQRNMHTLHISKNVMCISRFLQA